MTVLVAYGSKRGGTKGLAEMIGDALTAEGLHADVVPAHQAGDVGRYDAVVVGGALYAAHWHKDARRFVKRNMTVLATRPTYFFSSGPLDDTARSEEIPPVPGVQRLMTKVHARDHITFGGRLAPDAEGFPASAMAKTRAGDWRDAGQVRTWVHCIAADMACAR
ncbi:MAG TPA: flavodoxin domain-containing protein [Acidimicrobiales bacterium]|nr:flavodoxin domain-containing protein [Acidimicrobiales bacterium]